MNVSTQECGNGLILSTTGMFKDTDEGSETPSRLSEADLLLHARRNNNGPGWRSLIGCILIVLLALITLMVLLAWSTSLKTSPSNNSQNFWNQPIPNDVLKFDMLLKYLKMEIKAENIKKNFEHLAEKAHIAGTREQTHLMQWIAKNYEKMGFDVKVHNYTVLLNYPQISVPNLLELESEDRSNWEILSYGKGTPLGPEEAINEQQDIRAQQWWNAYSANGTVVGQIVYCNYGTKEDYEKLDRMGVSVLGRIALIRYGALKRSEKVKLAQRRGIVGVLLFSDPIHYTPRNRTFTFPENIHLPGDDVQRGSVLGTHGDPLTPLLPSLSYTFRTETESSAREKGVLPSIPVTPIGYNDADKIMALMDGDPAPAFEWTGGLNSVYRITGERTFRLTVHSRFVHKTISNVIATWRGQEEPDRWILFGNHVDAWGNGAVDPISATATAMEVARTASEAFKYAPPKRTTIFCHWDAEEYGLIGSTEWVEEMQHVLLRRAVAYINFDHIAGNVVPDVRGVPLLYRAVAHATKKVATPSKEEESKGRTRLFDSWQFYRGKGPVFGDRNIPEFGFPTPGSDYQRFISFLGIPSVDFKLENSPGKSYPLYHTMYETPWLVKNLIDPEFKSNLAVGQFWLTLVHMLSNSVIIPFDVTDYSLVLSTLLRKAEAHLNHLNVTRRIPFLEHHILELKAALKRFENVSMIFQTEVEEAQRGDKVYSRMEVEVLNSRLTSIERCFIDWTEGAQLNRHLVFSPTKHQTHFTFFSFIQDSAKDFAASGTEEDKKALLLAFSKLHLAVESAIATLTLDHF